MKLPGKSGPAYKEAGVDVSLGDLFSAYCGHVCTASYRNSRRVRVHDMAAGHFRGPRGFSFVGLPEGSYMTAGTDGIGTKVIPIDAAGFHGNAAQNLIAMCAGDITRYGGSPLVFLNHLDVASLGDDEHSSAYGAACLLMDGLADIAQDQGYVLLGGETAELRDCVKSPNPDPTLMFNWGGCMIGAYHPKLMILGDRVRPGQRVIALQDVTRSNGISLLRKGLTQMFGPDWYSSEDPLVVAAVREVAAPSALYDKFLTRLNGWDDADLRPAVDISLIAHLSGGGIKSKFGELLFKSGLSAVLDGLFEPPPFMKHWANWLTENRENTSDADHYETWGGGQGALIVTDLGNVDKCLDIAAEMGISAQDAGPIVETEQGRKPRIEIESRFSDGLVTYEME